MFTKVHCVSTNVNHPTPIPHAKLFPKNVTIPINIHLGRTNVWGREYISGHEKN